MAPRRRPARFGTPATFLSPIQPPLKQQPSKQATIRAGWLWPFIPSENSWASVGFKRIIILIQKSRSLGSTQTELICSSKSMIKRPVNPEPIGHEPFLRLCSTGRVGRARFRSANLVEVESKSPRINTNKINPCASLPWSLARSLPFCHLRLIFSRNGTRRY